jgi:BirA family biotin operon repressor/biotin-[acetyl-CoA-carboxylase] ligase
MISIHLTSTTSTNDTARGVAAAHPGRALLVSARTQTAGRGRDGRTWQSPTGGAWFSVAWPVTGSLQRYAAAPLVAGLALTRVIDSLLPCPHPPTQIKWPNDLLLRGGKVAGILCEAVVVGDVPPVLIVGVGLNANVDTTALGDDLRHPPIALRDVVRRRVSLQPLIGACGRAIADAIGGLERHGLTPDTVRAIESKLAWRGESVALCVGGTEVHGVLDGIETDGRVRLHTPQGVACYHSGEVTRVRPQWPTHTAIPLQNEVLV